VMFETLIEALTRPLDKIRSKAPNLSLSFRTTVTPFAFFFFHTLNLNVTLGPLESLFPGFRFGHKNDLEWNPDERVMPV